MREEAVTTDTVTQDWMDAYSARLDESVKKAVYKEIEDRMVTIETAKGKLRGVYLTAHGLRQPPQEEVIPPLDITGNPY